MSDKSLVTTARKDSGKVYLETFAASESSFLGASIAAWRAVGYLAC